MSDFCLWVLVGLVKLESDSKSNVSKPNNADNKNMFKIATQLLEIYVGSVQSQ